VRTTISWAESPAQAPSARGSSTVAPVTLMLCTLFPRKGDAVIVGVERRRGFSPGRRRGLRQAVADTWQECRSKTRRYTTFGAQTAAAAGSFPHDAARSSAQAAIGGRKPHQKISSVIRLSLAPVCTMDSLNSMERRSMGSMPEGRRQIRR